MKTYTVPIKKPTEEQETRFGVMGVPEAMMGSRKVYVYKDLYRGDFFPTDECPPELLSDANRKYMEYVVTIYPRDKEHLVELMAGIAKFHNRDLTPSEE